MIEKGELFKNCPAENVTRNFLRSSKSPSAPELNNPGNYCRDANHLTNPFTDPTISLENNIDTLHRAGSDPGYPENFDRGLSVFIRKKPPNLPIPLALESDCLTTAAMFCSEEQWRDLFQTIANVKVDFDSTNTP